MIPKFPVYLFDVDGTLVDSAQDICTAIASVLEKAPQPKHVEHRLLTKYVGLHLKDMFEDLIPGVEAEQVDRMIADYRATYLGYDHSTTRVYDGVIDALSKLDGRKSTATTKGSPTTRYVLEKFGLLPFFDHVQGTDGFPAKPAPDVIFKALEALGAEPQDCLLVGDSAADMQAGRRAGVKTCAVLYGYGNVEEMKQFEPDYWIEHLSELTGECRES